MQRLLIQAAVTAVVWISLSPALHSEEKSYRVRDDFGHRPIHSTGAYSRIALSPDGSQILISNDAARIVETATGRKTSVLLDKRFRLRDEVAFTFLPNDRLFADGLFSTTVWDIHTKKELFQIISPSRRKRGYSTSVLLGDSGFFAVPHNGDLSEIKIYQSSDGGPLTRVVLPVGLWRIESIASDQQGKILTAICSSTDLRPEILRWDLTKGPKLLSRVSLAGHLYISDILSLSTDGKYVAAYDYKDMYGNMIVVVDSEHGTEKMRIPATLTNSKQLIFTPDNTAIVIQQRQSSAIEVIPLDASQARTRLEGMYSEAYAVAVSADGTTLAAASDSEIRIWSVKSGRQLSTTTGPDPALRIESSGDYILTEGAGGVRIWNRRTKNLIWHDKDLRNAEMRVKRGSVFGTRSRRQIDAIALRTGKLQWSYVFGKHNSKKRPVKFAVSADTGKFAVTLNQSQCGIYDRSKDKFSMVFDRSKVKLRIVGSEYDPLIEGLTFDQAGSLILARNSFWEKPSLDSLTTELTIGLKIDRFQGSAHTSLALIENAYPVRFSADGKRCFALSPDPDDFPNEILLSYHLDPPKQLSSVYHKMTARAFELVVPFAASHDGARVALGNSLGEVSIYAANSGELITVLKHDSPITSIAFREGSEEIITGHLSGVISIWIPKDD